MGELQHLKLNTNQNQKEMRQLERTLITVSAEGKLAEAETENISGLSGRERNGKFLVLTRVLSFSLLLFTF